MASGIKDKVAILGMGCSRFGERWDIGTHQLLAEAFDEALMDAGIEAGQIDAAWYGSALDSVNVGNSAIPASVALRLDGIPVSRVENMQLQLQTVSNDLIERGNKEKVVTATTPLALRGIKKLFGVNDDKITHERYIAAKKRLLELQKSSIEEQ